MSRGPLEQVPARQLWPVPQVRHTPPPVPHALVEVPTTQAPLWQQPVGQVDGPQDWQVPPTHELPMHATHEEPRAPHAASVLPAAHWPEAVQHPEGQLDALHAEAQAWAVQLWPVPHVWQLAPRVPQALVEVPATQAPFWQQPLGQVVALHGGGVQAPAEQVSLPAQAAQAAPRVPQALVKVPGWQTPPVVQQPPQLAAEQAVWHTPLRQVPLPQSTQAAPLRPHDVALGTGMHC